MRKSGKYLTAAILAVSMAVTPITSYGFGWSKTEAAGEKKEESCAFKTGDTVISMGAEAAPILKALGRENPGSTPMKILSWAPPRHPERNVSNPFIFQAAPVRRPPRKAYRPVPKRRT